MALEFLKKVQLSNIKNVHLDFFYFSLEEDERFFYNNIKIKRNFTLFTGIAESRIQMFR
jgi:hypothetical protein